MKYYLTLYFSLFFVLISCNKDKQECHTENIFTNETNILIGDWKLSYIYKYQYNYNTGLSSSDEIHSYDDQIHLLISKKGKLLITQDNYLLDYACLNPLKNLVDTNNQGSVFMQFDYTAIQNQYKTIYFTKTDSSNYLRAVFNGYNLPYTKIENEDKIIIYSYYFVK